MSSRKSLPLPSKYAHDPAILAWRIDSCEERLDALESRPSISDTPPAKQEADILASLPPWLRRVIIAGLLAAGASGHFPEATKIALRLAGL